MYRPIDLVSTAWCLLSKPSQYYHYLSRFPTSQPSSFSLGTHLTGWFKEVDYGARDEIISFLSSTALFLLLMGSPAASEARGELRVLRKKELASNTRLTLRSCKGESGCFQHQMISDLKPQRRGNRAHARSIFHHRTVNVSLSSNAHKEQGKPIFSAGRFRRLLWWGTEFCYLG